MAVTPVYTPEGRIEGEGRERAYPVGKTPLLLLLVVVV